MSRSKQANSKLRGLYTHSPLRTGATEKASTKARAAAIARTYTQEGPIEKLAQGRAYPTGQRKRPAVPPTTRLFLPTNRRPGG